MSQLTMRAFQTTKKTLIEFSRDPLSLVDEVKYDAADTATRKDMLQKAKATATRNIFLIRHAQYLIDNEQKNLTPLGQEQAVLLGKRLAQEGLKFDVLIMSSMQRASETDGLILSQMAPLATKVDSILEAGAPYPPEPPVPQWRPKQKGSRIEAAFRKYIHRASPRQKEDSYEIIVCHGNIIRYFVCR
ncbi:Serine/threonine-protein phosphatase Pgam5, mitochondrial [Toxocara canis]|uniref:Serine/threonine-protein phosphatase PGAM5, mitochondrial n=1 Tax=Toxocara canis TaxID=6265 RepID=A0A0B2V5Y1_TOXCA|nr:Serine/threonine-protein phosphatase Pgam5, mitochondrial [Toxocara canis]